MESFGCICLLLEWRYINVQLHLYSVYLYSCVAKCFGSFPIKTEEIERERETETATDKQKHTQTETERDTEADKRHTHRKRHTERQRKREREPT